MQKRHYKMTLSILIATVLLLPILPISMTNATLTGNVKLKNWDPDLGDNVGDNVRVNGTGASAGVLVSVYWDKVQAANKLTTEWADGAGFFECNVTIPEDYVGDHYIIASDGVSTGSALFTIDPKIELTPESGISGDTIKVNGTGFADDVDIVGVAMRNATWSMNLTTSPSTPHTSDLGSFICTFTVPSKDPDDIPVVYGTYTVNATDEDLNVAEATFTIGPSITLSPEEGPSGTVVTVTGRGFKGKSGKYVTVLIYDTGVNMKCPLVANNTVASGGTFTDKFVVPTLDVDTYTVEAKVEDLSGTLDFEVTGTTEITLDPTSGAPGDTITIEGINFTAIANTEVTIKFGTLDDYATLKTNSTGGFKGTITVPSLAPNPTVPYPVFALDDNELNATADFTIALVTLAISPTSGPTGTSVLIIGSGFTPDKDFNVTIAGELAVDGEGTITSGGSIPSSFYVYVPTISTGVKKLTVMDTEGVSKSVNFEVTKTTEMILTPSSAPTGYNVTIELNYFTADSGIDITVTIYNSTYDESPTIKAASGFTAVETNGTGSFLGCFNVSDDLVEGDYKVNATDENDLSVTLLPFKVITPTATISTGASEYLPGDTVAFFAKCSFEFADQTINVYDPSWNLFSVGIDIETSTAGYYTGTAMMVLPSDAKLGVWNWNATIGADGTDVEGTFSVVAKPTLIGLSESLTKLSEAVDKLSDTVDKQAGDISTLSETVSDLKTALDALKTDLAKVDTTATSAQSAAQSASTAATDAKTAASDAATAATDAKTAAQAAQSTAAGISTAVYGAMVLSLVAAIAAIVAVITLQRKVAG